MTRSWTVALLSSLLSWTVAGGLGCTASSPPPGPTTTSTTATIAATTTAAPTATEVATGTATAAPTATATTTATATAAPTTTTTTATGAGGAAGTVAQVDEVCSESAFPGRRPTNRDCAPGLVCCTVPQGINGPTTAFCRTPCQTTTDTSKPFGCRNGCFWAAVP